MAINNNKTLMVEMEQWKDGQPPKSSKKNPGVNGRPAPYVAGGYTLSAFGRQKKRWGRVKVRGASITVMKAQAAASKARRK